ncbi:MAG: helix-turn-helix domain-containing protein [Azonexus sp.]
MNVHLKNAVPPVSNFVVLCHRPNYTLGYVASPSLQVRTDARRRQARDMRRFAGSCRFVFNWALTEWKVDPATDWLCDTPSQALQQTH